MHVQMNQVDKEHRDTIRALEQKPYIKYIRYLLLKRWSPKDVAQELMRMGLSWEDIEERCRTYFKQVLYPYLKKADLHGPYRGYRIMLEDDELFIGQTFGNDETQRIRFIKFTVFADVDIFFYREIAEFYEGTMNIPPDPDGAEETPLVPEENDVNLLQILQSEYRSTIERLLVEGYSSASIREFLLQRYGVEAETRDINGYARAFFDIKRGNIQHTIDTLVQEKDELQAQLTEIRTQKSHKYSMGQRFEVVTTLNSKIEKLQQMIQRLSSVHTGTTYGAGILEQTDIKEMFQDVNLRLYRRFREVDEQEENEAVGYLQKIVSTMSMSAKELRDIDEAMSKKTSQSAYDQMMDMILPTVERAEEEEREARQQFRQENENEDLEDIMNMPED